MPDVSAALAHKLARRGRAPGAAPHVSPEQVLALLPDRVVASLLHDGEGWSVADLAGLLHLDAASVRGLVARERLRASRGSLLPCEDRLDDLMTFDADTVTHAVTCTRCGEGQRRLREGRRLIRQRWRAADIDPVRPWDGSKTRKTAATDEVADPDEVVIPAILQRPARGGPDDDTSPRPASKGLPPPTVGVAAYPPPRPDTAARLVPVPGRAPTAQPQPVPARRRRSGRVRLPLTALGGAMLAMSLVAAVAAGTTGTSATDPAGLQTVATRLPGPAEYPAVLPGQAPLATRERAVPASPTPTPAPTVSASPSSTATAEQSTEPQPTESPPAPTPTPQPPPPPAVPTHETWEQVAHCESGGDWTADTGNGYYGGLQFLPESWVLVGGQGLPHEASKQEQIARAQSLWEVQGWEAWPVCSRRLGLR